METIKIKKSKKGNGYFAEKKNGKRVFTLQEDNIISVYVTDQYSTQWYDSMTAIAGMETVQHIDLIERHI